jgi:nucleoside-diphosphate-sugar epimerase
MNTTFQNRIKKEYSEKKILVTGASGYLSTNLIDSLKDVDCTVIRLSRKGVLPPIAGKAHVIDRQGDIVCRETWEQVLGEVDIVYHMAGQTTSFNESIRFVDKYPLAPVTKIFFSLYSFFIRFWKVVFIRIF